MAEPSVIVFSHKELVATLVKAQGLHEGIWGLYLRFGIKGANIGNAPSDIMPAAVIPVLEVGLQRFEQVNNISVDAAESNPKPHVSTQSSKGSKQAKRKR
jgi:hypothetical protein